MGAMMARWLALPLLAWVLLDFSSPLVPGAVSFDVADSVEAVRATPPSAEAPNARTATLPMAAVAPVVERAPIIPRPEPVASTPRVPVRVTGRARLSADPPPGPDDH
jgi:hypothetical protein